jgi:hypothetical protein
MSEYLVCIDLSDQCWGITQIPAPVIHVLISSLFDRKLVPLETQAVKSWFSELKRDGALELRLSIQGQAIIAMVRKQIEP